SSRYPRLHSLLQAFEKETGCPVLINTSFNVRGEPVVCSPEEAFRCFRLTNMDVLVLENVILRKQDQSFAADKDLTSEHLSNFALD
ncbi:MAG: carbamoyltransferase C-terminal domain-containing protein, partial [Pseudomonadota bacterium]